ncbi:amidase family protein, partial [Nocardia abscessus]|uniref:amidase family protein n=1 Tax=Nocardia abscessus TaxID=120957 RepID=UPI002454B955
AAALRVGAVTSVELTDEAIARIERDDKVINAICVPDFDNARAAARDADQARARGEDRPLLGKTNVPVVLRDIQSFNGIYRHGWRQLFAEFDAVVCPITPTPAFPHDHNGGLENRHIDIDGIEYPYFDQLVWAGVATMPGLPATAIPAGRSPEGLPVGVQLIGPMFEDRTLLRLAELLEQKIGGFQAPK